MLFAGRPVAVSTAFERLLFRVNDKHGTVSLCCTCDHIRDKVHMAGGIKNRKVTIRSCKITRRELDRNTALLLLLSLIHDVCELEPNLVVQFCLTLISTKLLFRDKTILQQYLSRKCAFTTINMANNNQVQV